ncbi:sodium-dependent nutrient amino acid transporter 1-like [Ischnura elegans]|uniref:sodium-dependent nutrient amino acid transporter 1-like n=1 Tax=Ischnura elegans TaxID=197161 RepID=UPI001ED8869B|nr:sodium-dependent nutrient amino acid transporter 1-like [Ischnura elegans]XP_046404061.1 sodium-dependent nutrient amino acid transporter 1-like [Ischnura elegans]XP_046404069.1 sodium-dependent nutrient amino acid transporter 1-like [Ischnura elegans]
MDGAMLVDNGGPGLEMTGAINYGYEATPETKEGTETPQWTTVSLKKEQPQGESTPQSIEAPKAANRQEWDKPIEFLLSCISMSVGLGNLWRFPVTAFENGGGAFLIPYIIVLFVIGKPLYYMEMAVGQFCNLGPVKIWNLCPAFRGVGWGQVISMTCVATYYCSLMAISVFYFCASFTSELPWSQCEETWKNCSDSKPGSGNSTAQPGFRSSSEIYFLRTVLNQKENIDDGIGLPDWRLTLCLLFAWAFIFIVLSKGVKSSGKAAYFTAIFPYIVLVALLIRGATLPGAVNGIIYFINPRWEDLLKPTVWTAAITQCFFSLNVSFGSVIFYSSYNNFRHNYHRDVWIITTLDTFTSLLAGFTIFSILGNLAYELGVEDIRSVVQGGTGLAFVSYPDAIAKFKTIPQLFSVLFFLMLFVLGIGSAVSVTGALVTIYKDFHPNAKIWKVTLIISIIGFASGIAYVTQGGQFILALVDYYGASFIVYVLSTLEVIAISWVYGLENLCQDIYFAIGEKVGAYWRLCWGILIPCILCVILTYSFMNFIPLTYAGIPYPFPAHAFGIALSTLGLIPVPIWMAVELFRHREKTFFKMVKSAFSPNEKWGPANEKVKEEWQLYKEVCRSEKSWHENKFKYVIRILFGVEKR